MQEYICQLNYDEKSATVMGYRGDERDVLIPETFGGKPVTILYDKVFEGHLELCSVRIPSTVTDLGEFLFDGCLNLRHIELPESLQTLWGYTFVRCGLEEIVLPDSLTTIPPYAFKDCKDLKKVVCGPHMRKIHAWAFGGCSCLQEFICPKEAEISPDAFATNDSIMRLSYNPKGV